MIRINYNATGKTPEEAAENAKRFYDALPEELKTVVSRAVKVPSASPTSIPVGSQGRANQDAFTATYGPTRMTPNLIERLGLTGNTSEEQYGELIALFESKQAYRDPANRIHRIGGDVGGDGAEDELPQEESGKDVFA